MKMGNLSDDAVIKENILRERIENADWTQVERLFKNRWSLVRPKLQTTEIPLSLALKMLYRRTIFGEYLDEFNSREHQSKYLNTNKLAMTVHDQKSYMAGDWLRFTERHADFLLMDNPMMQLKNAIGDRDLLNTDYFRDRINCVRLTGCFINELDCGLLNYRKLKIIRINENWIRRIPGGVFPRALQQLDLYANNIDEFDGRISNLPRISVLGLGRNSLHDDSGFHLLGVSHSLQRLRCLDLSNNDICDLLRLLTCIIGLRHLSSLDLEGNPCYVHPCYKDEILRSIPTLIYLDAVQLSERDRELATKDGSVEEDPALVFACHRIIGLPPPPKQKGVVQTIHLEVTFPLLEEVIIPKEDLEIIETATPQVEPNDTAKRGKKGAAKKKSAKGNKKSDSGGKGSKKSKSKSSTGSGKSKKTGKRGKKGKKDKGSRSLFYNAEDEYESETKARLVNRAFCTERVPWSKVIQFPEDAIVIKSPESNNVTAIRDTFRTRVNVKVVYLKIQIPQKAKKQKKKSKSKSRSKSKSSAKKNKSKSQKSSSKKGKSVSENAPVIVEEEEPKEVILKKVTLASFNCNLYPISWSDKTIDFYWADHDDCKPDAICVDGSLRAINYGGAGGKKEKKKPAKPKDKAKVKGDPLQQSDIEPAKNELQSLPKIFTVQVGFGLRRSYVL